jgi:uncharacterized FAD-dependent dehydrogenase
MTVTKSIERFRKVKERIRQAIISKGVAVAENASLSEMAAKIEEIKTSKTKKKEDKNNG